MYDSDLSKSKIININDFIFRQNLEFYPNLDGLSCVDNVLYYKKDNNIVDSITLTFDLRTLPGEAWNVTPEEFLQLIKLNKDCKGLYKFLEIIEKYAFSSFIKPEEREA